MASTLSEGLEAFSAVPREDDEKFVWLEKEKKAEIVKRTKIL